MKIQTALILLFLLALSLSPSAASSAAQPTHASTVKALYRVYFQSEVDLQQLAARLDVWEVHRTAGWLLAYLAEAEVQRVSQAGFHLELDAPANQAISKPRLLSPDQASGIPGYACYRTVEETLSALGGLVAQYPALASASVIGQSWTRLSTGGAAGYTLDLLKLTNSQVAGPKPILFVMAEIHAREYVTAETALRFAEYLLQNYGVDPDVTWLLDYNEIDILPLTNPDGRKKAEEGLFWRKNLHNTHNCPYEKFASSDGVDLNRNSSFGWGGNGASSYPCDETYLGSAAASEPETQALQDYLAAIFPDRRGPNRTDAAPLDYQGLLISLHSYGQYVLWPFADINQPSANNVQLQTLGRKLAYFNAALPGQAGAALYPASGITEDFAYGTLGVPAYTFEMGTSFFQDCAAFESSLWPDNRAALEFALKAARLPYQTPAGPEITNPHLQGATLSPSSEIVLLATASDNRYSSAGGTEPSQNIQAARFSIDAPSWMAGAVLNPLTAADGAFDSTSEEIRGVTNTTGLAPGRHIIYIEAQDAQGQWGVPSAVFLTVQDTYNVAVVPDQHSKSGPVGSAITFTLTITNLGKVSDSYTLSVHATPAWEAQLSAQVIGPLAPAESALLTITVNIPSSPAPTSATIAVEAQSQGAAEVKATTTLQAQALWTLHLPLALK